MKYQKKIYIIKINILIMANKNGQWVVLVSKRQFWGFYIIFARTKLFYKTPSDNGDSSGDII